MPDKTWVGADGANWNDDGNWNPNGVPTTGDDVYISSGNSCMLDIDIDIGSLAVTTTSLYGGGHNIIITANHFPLAIDGGAVQNINNLSVGAYGISIINGGYLSMNSDLTLTGNLSGDSNQSFTCGGTATLNGGSQSILLPTGSSTSWNNFGALVKTTAGTLTLKAGEVLQVDAVGTCTFTGITIVSDTPGTRAKFSVGTAAWSGVTISDLENNNSAKIIRAKGGSQRGNQNTRGIVFNFEDQGASQEF